jgi:hypothetical protein
MLFYFFFVSFLNEDNINHQKLLSYLSEEFKVQYT